MAFSYIPFLLNNLISLNSLDVDYESSSYQSPFFCGKFNVKKSSTKNEPVICYLGKNFIDIAWYNYLYRYSLWFPLHLPKDHYPYPCVKDRERKSATLYWYLATFPFFSDKRYEITLHFVKVQCVYTERDRIYESNNKILLY